MSWTINNIRPHVQVWIHDEHDVRPELVDEVQVAVQNALDEVAKRFLDPDNGIDVLVV